MSNRASAVLDQIGRDFPLYREAVSSLQVTLSDLLSLADSEFFDLFIDAYQGAVLAEFHFASPPLGMSIPGLPALSVSIGSVGEVVLEVALVLDGEGARLVMFDAPIFVEVPGGLLTPVVRVDDRWEADVDSDGVVRKLAFSFSSVSFELSSAGAASAAAETEIDLPPVRIGASGVIAELRGVRPLVRAGTTSGGEETTTGFVAAAVRIDLPTLLMGEFGPDEIRGENLFLGNEGFSGALSALWPEGKGVQLGTVEARLASLLLVFRRNSLIESELLCSVMVPFFEQEMGVAISFAGDGALLVSVSGAQEGPTEPSGGLVTLGRAGIFEMAVTSLGLELESGSLLFGLSGQLTPLLGGLDWPTFDVRELSIDSEGNVHLDGGWLDLPRAYTLDLHLFRMEITKLGFGKTEDGGKYVAFSGSVELVKGIPAGASVEGLRIVWYEDGREPQLTFNGVGVEFSVPDVIHFKGEVSYEEQDDLRAFTGDVRVELPVANDLVIEGKVVFGSDVNDDDERFKYFALYLDGEFGKGIPLWTTDLGLYGIAGLFSVNYAPKREPDMLWYSLDRSESWFHQKPEGVTDIVKKWRAEEDAVGIGAGATIATLSDNGFKFNGSFLLLLLFPGPVLLIEGRASFLRERAALDDEPQFHALVVLDARAGYFLIGLDAKWKKDEKRGSLIDLSGSAEAFFDFHDPRNWHLYLGKRDPLDQRIRAVLAQVFNANAYFMLDPRSLAVGVWIGREERWKFGPVRAELGAWLDANALVSFDPAHFHAALWLHGSLAVRLFRFRLGLGIDARLAADVATPFHIVGTVAVTIETPLKDFDVRARLEWGPRPERPERPGLFRSTGVGHFKSTAEWALPDAVTGPLVPMDCRPFVTFELPVHDAIGIGVNPAPDPGWVTIGDPGAERGSAQVRHTLEEVVLTRADGTVVARTPPREDEEPLYGSWAPSPLPPGEGAAGQNKLWLWSKNPLDHAANTESWNPWLTDHLPGYPCPVVPEVETCVGFEEIPQRTVLRRPWSDAEHPEIRVSWQGGQNRRVVSIREPVDGVRHGLPFPAVWPEAGPFVYVARDGDATVVPLLTTTDSLVGPPTAVGGAPGTAGGARPLALAVTPDGSRILVAEDGGTLVAIDTATNRLTGPRLEIPANPRGIAVTPDGTKGYVTSATTRGLTAFDPRRLALLATATLRDVAEGIAVTPDGAKVYVAHPTRGSVSIVETSNNMQGRPLTNLGPVRRLATAPVGNRLYLALAETEGRILQVDTTRDVLVGEPIPVGDFPRALAVTPDGAKVYVANARDDTVSVIDAASLEVTATLTVGARPFGLALTPDGGRLYVANTGGGTLTVIDTATDTVLPGRIAAGASPQAMAVTPGPLDVRRWPEPPVQPHVPDVSVDLPSGTIRVEVLYVADPGNPWGVVDEPPGAGRTLAEDRGDRLVFDAPSLGLQELRSLRLLSREDWILMRICIFELDSSVSATEISRVRTEIDRQLALWEEPGDFLDPFTEYILRLAVRQDVQGLGKLKRWQPEAQTRILEGRFLTSGPPGLGGLGPPLGGGDPDQRGTGLGDLGRYVEQTLPATVPAQGELPSLPRPFYRAYDVALRFNEDYVEGLYARARRPLTLHLHDNNDRPVRNARGDLLSLANPWGEAEDPVLTEVEARWVEMVGGAPCLPRSLDPERFPRHQTLTAAAGHVLAPDAVYEARLVPQLLLEDFSDPARWRPTGDDLLELRNGPPERWPDGRPSTWTDYRLEVLVQPVARQDVTVDFRFRNRNNHYRLSLHPGAKRRDLGVVEGGTYRRLARSRFVYRARTVYNLTIEAVGSRLRVLQDGDLVFDVEDGTHGAGRIGLSPWDDDGPDRFLLVRVEDFREQAPVAYRFRFTSSLYANFFHQIHSFDDVAWPEPLPPEADLGALRAAAADPAGAPSDAEVRAYERLADAVLGPAAAVHPPRVEVTRVERGGSAVALLFRSPEPLGGERLGLEVLRAPETFAPVAPPESLKVTDVQWGDGRPDEETVILLLREPLDLTRRRVEVRMPPGPLVEPGGDPVLLLSDFSRPGSPEGFDVVDRGDTDGPSRWRIREGALVQRSRIGGGAEPDDPGTLALVGDTGWTDLQVTVRLRSDSRGALGVVFRYTDPDNFYRLASEARRGFTRLVRVAAGEATVLWEEERSYTVGEPFTAVVKAAGSRLRGFIDGEELFDVEDSTLPRGRVGIYSYRNPLARCIRLEVRRASLEARALFLDGFAEGDLAGWSRLDEAPGATPPLAIVEGALRLSSEARAGGDPDFPGTLARAPGAAPAEFALRVRFASPTGAPIGVVFLGRSLDDYYRFSASQRDGYRLLIRKTGGTVEELWRDAAGYETDREYELTLVVADGAIRGYLDGVALFAVEDQDLEAAGRRYALYCRDNSDARFSEVRLHRADAAFADWLLDEPFAVHRPEVWRWEVEAAPSPEAWEVEDGALRPGSSWSPVGGGADQRIHTLASQGEDLFLGGTFRTAGGLGANRVARWDGERFHSLGRGINGPVRALAPRGRRRLYAAGRFSRAGGMEASNIALWNRRTGTWSALGDGVDGPVLALVNWRGSLIAGGRFTTAGGQPARNLARWDPATGNWEEVGGGVNREVHALAVWRRRLVVGGRFTEAGDQPVQRVAAWDGQSWDDLGGGVNGLVRTVGASRGDLVAGGRFTVAGGARRLRIARWDGRRWSALGDGLDAEVFSLDFHGNEILVGGRFQRAGALAAPHVARWNRTVDRWLPAGSGADGLVRAVVAREGSFAVGGDFRAAGDAPADRLARFTPGVQRTALAGAEDWQDYRLSSRLHPGFDGATGVLFRYRDRENFYALLADSENHRLHLLKIVDGQVTTLGEAAFAPASDRDYLLTVECCGSEMAGFLDAVPLFRLKDRSLGTGGVGLATTASAGARVSELRVAEPVWSPFYAFGREEPLAAGTRVALSSGSQREDSPSPGDPHVLHRFAAAVGDHGRLRLPTDRADLRISGPGRSTEHTRRFLKHATAYTAKVLRKADGTALGILPVSSPTLDAGTYRLEFTYWRDLGDPLTRQSQAGLSEPERVQIDIPWDQMDP